jgi:hypothetical protein
VVRVSDEDPALLRHVADLALVPGALVSLVERAPFDGPLTIDVDARRCARGADGRSEGARGGRSRRLTGGREARRPAAA